MTGSPKNLPRFLPTLTEVVSSVDEVRPELAGSQVEPSPVAAGDSLVDDLVNRVQERLLDHLGHAVNDIIAEQVDMLSVRLRQDMAAAVRTSVVAVLNEELGRSGHS